ncbi:HNH endonuclease [Streptomyces chartreusis]|uniref:HNH endonuclease n=1 Tax=Streptomyces chartreusis TaxID=1969 RepID=UPI002E16FB7E
MPVSKRTRFEVLRRDGFRCRYCGATPEMAELTVDHVTPMALGGGDEPGNLVTACEPCNSGKTSTAPDGAVQVLLPVPATVQITAVQRAAWGLLAEYTVAELTAPLGESNEITEINIAGLWFYAWERACGSTPSDDLTTSFVASVAASRAGYSAPLLRSAAQFAGEAKTTDVRPYAQALHAAAMATLHALQA